MNKQKVSQFKIDDNIISNDASYRGGTIKVNVSELFPTIDKDNAIMGAYQNYLGGGMRGAVCGGAMFEPSDLSTDAERALFTKTLEAIKKYFYAITNDEELGDNDEWNTMPYEKQQAMPVSAY